MSQRTNYTGVTPASVEAPGVLHDCMQSVLPVVLADRVYLRVPQNEGARSSRSTPHSTVGIAAGTCPPSVNPAISSSLRFLLSPASGRGRSSKDYRSPKGRRPL